MLQWSGEVDRRTFDRSQLAQGRQRKMSMRHPMNRAVMDVILVVVGAN
jgi:hypothetical protein